MAAMVIPAKRHSGEDLDYRNDVNDSDSDSYSDASYSSYSDHDMSLEPIGATTTTTRKVKRPKKMHPCPYPDCGKIYSQKPKLTDHILSHTGEVRMVSLVGPSTVKLTKLSLETLPLPFPRLRQSIQEKRPLDGALSSP